MMNEKNILFGKMFLIFTLLFTMPFAYADTGLGGVTSGLGTITNMLGGTIGNMLNPETTLGKITLTTGVLAASFYGGEALQNKLADGSPVTKEGAQWGNIFGQVGALLGAGLGGKTSMGGSGVGAIVGGLANLATTIIAGGIYSAQNKTIATIQRMIYVRVKTLDVNAANMYEPKFKDHGSKDITTKVTSEILLDQNYVRKSNEKYNVYYPVELKPNQKQLSELEHTVLGLDVKGLPETLGKTPLGTTITDTTTDQTANTVEALTLTKDSTKKLGWCNIENQNKLAELDNNVSTEYVERSIEEAQVQGRESFVLLFRNLADEEQIINIPNYNCFGANGLRGATGAQYKPRVEYNWKYSPEWYLGKCNSVSADYIYCDALQFNMALLNLFVDSGINSDLKSIKSQSITNTMDMEINDSTKNVYSKLNYKAYLMKDGYTKDFFNDFVDYALNTTFLGFPENVKPVIKELYENGKIEFKPLSYSATNAEGYKLESAGLYNVTVNITYKIATGDKYIYDNSRVNSNIEKITIYLELVSKENNPVYYMPLDATMGVSNGVIERIGYGVDYKGDAIWFKKEINNPLLLEPTLRSNSSPIVSLNMGVESSVDALNGFNKGLLLQISPRASATGVTYDVKRYLSYPAPVGLELNHTKAGDAYAFYTINVANSPRTAGNSFIDWTLVCEEGFDCKSFDGSSTLDEIGRADIYGVNSKVPIGQYQSIAYGLYWDKDSIIRDTNTVRYVSLVYLPEDASGSMNIVTSSGEAKVYPNTEFTNGGANINLSQTHEREINDLEKIYDLVADGEVCVGYTEGSYDIKFWWNPAIFFP